MLYLTDWTGTPLQILAVVFLLCGPVFFATEAHGAFAFGYSKFAKREARFTVPSKVGMFVVYFPAVLAYPAMHLAHGAPNTPWHLLAMALIVLHFAKRCVEALVVHRYSGVMNGDAVVLICALYTFLSATLGWVASTQVTEALLASEAFRPLVVPGLALWVLGTAINGWHHVLLARLRPPGDTEYRVPTGGLFGRVACPHYLGELVAWWGYALLFAHFSAWAFTWTMTWYLAGRSYNTLRRYRDKGLAVPQGWSRLVPGVY